MSPTFRFKGQVKKFPGTSGWTYVQLPKDTLPKDIPTGAWGFIKAKVTIGKTTWHTSILPMGNGHRFIALKANVRKKENIQLGNNITVSFALKDLGI